MSIWKGKPAVHVLPKADYIDHETSPDCICGPRVEDHPPGKVYVHFSLDGREFREKKNG